MRFWKGYAYLVIEFPGRELRLDKADEDGRRLALDFETTASRSKEPNQGVFTLYNLQPSTRQDIESNATGLRCYAGYEDNAKLIFSADVVFVASKRNGADWETKIQAGDGFAAFSKSVTSKTYASGTEKQEIVKQIAADMKLAVKQTAETIVGALGGSVSFDSKSKDALDVLTRDNGAEWSIQDRELHITKIGQPIDNEAIVLRADTGLLEHPTITDKGVNIKAQLNPDIRPGKLVKLEATGFEAEQGERGKDYNGLYLCQSVRFLGNNYGGPFDVMIEAVRYD